MGVSIGLGILIALEVEFQSLEHKPRGRWKRCRNADHADYDAGVALLLREEGDTSNS